MGWSKSQESREPYENEVRSGIEKFRSKSRSKSIVPKMLNQVNSDPDLPKWLKTGDELLVYDSDIEAKAQSSI